MGTVVIIATGFTHLQENYKVEEEDSKEKSQER